jgi:uncharacterized protein (TIGR02246 family)
MQKSVRVCLFCLLSLAGIAASQAEPPAGAVEQAILALEDQWARSQRTNDPDLVAPLFADRLLSTSTDGKLSGKAETLADARKTKWTTVEYTNMQVTVFGDTAIATGIFRGKGTGPGGKPLDEYERFTDTWVKMPNGKWQCVATQDSNVKN